jgi:hypothetical protein
MPDVPKSFIRLPGAALPTTVINWTLKTLSVNLSLCTIFAIELIEVQRLTIGVDRVKRPLELVFKVVLSSN